MGIPILGAGTTVYLEILSNSCYGTLIFSKTNLWGELQTVQTLIRLLLEEQSDLGLHCLPRPVCPKTYEH